MSDIQGLLGTSVKKGGSKGWKDGDLSSELGDPSVT